jgi:flagellar hook-associated protein 3 FlgL
MSLNRVSSVNLTNQSVHYLSNNYQIMSRIQERISSGKNITRPSHDPVGLTRILDISSTLRADERFKLNIDNAISEVNTADTAMKGMTELLHRAKELAVQGASATNSGQELNSLAQEVNALINQFVQLGNTRLSNQYIFSGMRTDTETFNRVGDTVTFSGTAPAEDYQRIVEIGQGIELPLNINGESLLGSVTVAPGPPAAVTGGSGVFRTLMTLKLGLEQNDKVTVRNSIDSIQTDLNTVLANQAIIGATANRLELTQERISARKVDLTKQFSGIQEIDLAKSISDLSFQEAVFNASLGVAGRVLQTSLLNFLR